MTNNQTLSPEPGKRETSSGRCRLRLRRTVRGLIGAAGAVAAGACISPSSPLLEESAEGCSEFRAGQGVDSDVKVDANVKTFMIAASDFVAVADRMEDAVLTACAAVARDLGAGDTWSAIPEKKERISNSSGTGACDAAGRRMEDILVAAGTVNAKVALAVSRGQCHADFTQQASCDAACSAQAVCDSGTVETRCEPGKLTVFCEAACQAGAVCVGTPELPANCMGKCESTCTGLCKGTCIGPSGRATENDPNCMGKCAASCNGTCRGQCKIDAPEGVVCGADVRCTGGCSSTYSDPVCTSEFQPPSCTVDADCHAACSARVIATAKCDPTRVEVFADVASSPELEPLIATLQTNLPPLIDVAEVQGKLVIDAAHRLGQSGEALSSKLENLDGKSLACLGESASALGVAIGKIDVAGNASATLVVNLEGKTL